MPYRGIVLSHVALVLLFGLVPQGLQAQGVDYVKANYTKYEYHIPMRDGVRLFTAVYVPKDDSRVYPIIMNRSPYSSGPYGVDKYRLNLGPSPLFGKEGYIFVYQDVRGCWMSEGTFVNMRPHIPAKSGQADTDESSDTYDTIEWLLKHIRHNNGKVGQWGISYPGFYTAAGMIDAHPALKASSPQAPINDWFIGDDFHHNGALFLPHMFNFFASFGKARPKPTSKRVSPGVDHGTPDGYDFFLRLGPLSGANEKYFKGSIAFWNEASKHGSYDEFWQKRNLRPHLKNIKPAVMTVGGWFDAENLFGALETFKNVEANHPPEANHLVMGPWFHGGWSGGDGESLGSVRFNSKTSQFYREKVEFPFFEHHLKGKGSSPLPKALVFETGTNQWRRYDVWPPAAAKRKSLYFHAGGRLSFDAPTDSGEAFDEYISDPDKPVPYYDKVSIGMAGGYVVADQRFAACRTDVLTYTTDVLTEDVAFVGPVGVDLTVSTTGTDSDWIVKLIDVYPNDYPDPNPNPTGVRMGGYQQLVRGDVMRGKFRESFEKPTAFVPGEPTTVRFTMQDICHTFRPGHRIMVQVQSSWFPLVDRNPQTFVDIYNAKAADFRKTTQRVYHSAAKLSRLQVPVIP